AQLGVVVFANNQWQRLSWTENLDAHGGPKFFYQDRESRFWFGTGYGVLCEAGGQWSCYSTTNGLSHGDVRVIYQDRRDDMWFGTFGGGLNRLHDGKITSYTTTRGDYNNCAWWIHEDADGVFW